MHSKSLWARLRVQKHCAGALKVTLGSQGQSKTPRKLEKIMRRCTQSHFGLTCAFKNTAQVYSKSLWAHKGSHFAYKYVYILHGTLKNTCVFATYAHRCAKTHLICIYSAWDHQTHASFHYFCSLRAKHHLETRCFCLWTEATCFATLLKALVARVHAFGHLFCLYGRT